MQRIFTTKVVEQLHRIIIEKIFCFVTALLLEASRQRQLLFRTYRVEKHYAVSSGKWYFEFEVMTAGPMRVGWAKADCMPGSMLGSDESTWAFDGYNVSF